MKSKMKQADPPVNLVMPNTTELKMQAILAVAEAIKNVSKALISTNVQIDICNNHIIAAKQSGITIETTESC